MLRAIYTSPLGDIELTGDATTLRGLRFVETGAEEGRGRGAAMEAAFRWLDLYFAGQAPDLAPRLQPEGTAFQHRVWQELMKIPYGETDTYGAIARRVGCRSAQAVGQAIGRNPIAIIIPCHRVVGAEGRLTGYAYGVERKRRLIEMEAAGAVL